MKVQLNVMSPIQNILANSLALISAEINLIQNLQKKGNTKAILIGDIHYQRNAKWPITDPAKNPFIVPNRPETGIPERATDAMFRIYTDKNFDFGFYDIG